MQLGTYRPVFVQITDLIILEILEKKLVAGDALPEINALSLSTKVNPVIVTRAYEELKELKVVTQEEEKQEFIVTDEAYDILQKKEKERFIRYDFPEIVRRVKVLGIDPKTLDWDK